MQHAQPAAEFLLVDDDPSVSEFLATYLSERGHPSNATIEGDKALNWLSENQCEVVVVDLNLPNANGMSLIASLRAIDARLPIVVFDGKGTSATEQSEPHGVQVFYSRAGQTADAIIERLASKYAGKFDLKIGRAHV